MRRNTLAQQRQQRRASFHTSGINQDKKDYYETLGVSKDADAKSIKKAYYQLAKKYHPDTNKGDTNAQKKFQDVSEAYECLSDDGKRRQYDAFGGAPGAGAADGFAAGMGGFGRGGFKATMDPEELFKTIFGDRFGSAQSPGGFSGADGFTSTEFDFGATPEYQMSLSFAEAARGISKDIYVSVTDTCVKCGGNGSEPGSKPERCPQCAGTGMETVSTGPFMMRSTCRRCHGKGVHNRDPCRECRGGGATKQRRKVSVPVPAGIEDGQTVRMPVGKKEVFITFKVSKSDYFRRQGADVHTDAKISVAQAILGGAIRVQGIYEDMSVQIPTGSPSHARIRMNGKGIAKVSGHGYGDHYIHIKIATPKSLDGRQRALVQAYAELESDTPGTIQGFTYTKAGNKVVMEDPDGLIADLREALEDDQPEPERTPNSEK